MNALLSVRSSDRSPRPPSSSAAIVESRPPSGRSVTDGLVVDQQRDLDPEPRGLTRLRLEVEDVAGERNPDRGRGHDRTDLRGRTADPVLERVHRALAPRAFGLPTSPGGRCSATWDGVDAKSAWITTLAGAPAWVVDGVTVNEAWAGAAKARKSSAAITAFTHRAR
jgi:hypothetical protein